MQPRAEVSEPSVMWMSSIPRFPTDVTPLRNTNQYDRGSTCQLRLHVDFGGPNGERLRLLNRVVGVFDARYDILVGLRFAYDDGTERFYGSCQRLGNETRQRPYHEMSFIVDGKQGERVDEIAILPYRHRRWFKEFVGGLQVCLYNNPSKKPSLSPVLAVHQLRN